MNNPLELRTTRLHLRVFTAADAPRVQQLAGDRRIADVTANVPHPYPDGLAEKWIAGQAPARAARTLFNYALTLADNGELVGAMGIMNVKHREGELGYWIGVPYWRCGYATEAAIRVVQCGFEDLELKRIHARVLSRNPASSRVLLKAGFSEIGEIVERCGEQRPEAEPMRLYEAFAPGAQ